MGNRSGKGTNGNGTHGRDTAPAMLTIHDVAAMARISPSTIRRLLKEKDPAKGANGKAFPQPMRIGKQIDRWNRREVAEYFGLEVAE